MQFENDPPRGAPHWCVSYGDMMSLLLGFFILLYAMAGLDKQHDFEQMVQSFQERFGFRGEGGTWFPGPHTTFGPRVKEHGAGSSGGTTDENSEVRNAQGTDRALVNMPKGGESRLGVRIFFPESGSQLQDTERKDLRRFADLVRGKRQKIEVRGHASGRPPAAGDSYRDDWDLAFQRSHAAMTFLVEETDIDAARIRLSVAGRNEPLPSSAAPGDVSLNSRVEVFLMDEMARENGGEPSASPTMWLETEGILNGAGADSASVRAP